MKVVISLKTVKTFSVIVLLLFTLSSCTPKGNALLDLEDNILQPQKFSFETEYPEYSSDVKTISYIITNISDEVISVSTEMFELQYKTDDGWKVVAFKEETGFTLLAIILKPNESTKVEIQLDQYYNLPLTSGEYRLIKNSYASTVFKVY